MPTIDLSTFASTFRPSDFIAEHRLKIDEQALKEKNLSMSVVLSQVYSEVSTSERVFEFARENKSQTNKESQEKENLTQARIGFLTKAGILKRLESEASKHYLALLHNKELMAQLHARMMRIAEENYRKMINEVNSEQDKADMERAMQYLMQRELDRLNDLAMQEWNDHQSHIDRLDKEITHHRSQRDNILNKHIDGMAKAVGEFKPLAALPDEKRKALAADYAVEGEKLEQRIKQADHKKSRLENEIKDLDQQEKNLVAKIAEEEGPKIKEEQRRDQDLGVYKPQQNLKARLATVIENNEEVQQLRKEKQIKQGHITALDATTVVCKQQLDNLLKECLKKAGYTADEIAKLYQDHPSIEKDFKAHMEKSEGYKNFKEEIGAVNKFVFEKKGEKELRVQEQKKIEISRSDLATNVRQMGLEPKLAMAEGFVRRKKSN